MKKIWSSLLEFFRGLYGKKHEELKPMQTNTIDVNKKNDGDTVVVADGIFPIEKKAINLKPKNGKEVIEFIKDTGMLPPSIPSLEDAKAHVELSEHGADSGTMTRGNHLPSSSEIMHTDQVTKLDKRAEGIVTDKDRVKAKAKSGKKTKKQVKQSLSKKYNPNVKRGVDGRFESKK